MQRSAQGKYRLLRHTEGASAVEMALILPFLVLFICGIMDFGNIFYQEHMVSEAARAGARYASVDPNLASIPTDVTNYIKSNYGSSLTVTTIPSTLVSRGNITVQVSNSVNILTPIISAFFPNNPYTIQGKCVMGLEN
jgi:Flp pilus assembly protein TadG